LIEEYFSGYSKECQGYSDYVIGLLYLLYFDNLKSIDKAVKYLESSSNSDNYDAMGTLGTIYFSDGRYFNIKKGVKLLEDASGGGNTEAMRNLFVFSKKGFYDQDKGYKWLVSSMNLGNENSAIYFAQEL
ncbi:hypothetical protein QE250_17065, partial [Chromatiaceae bacterium AAb-1]|nr:hypothetical protein [Chromatiaceae bacterium AAb-1]